MIPGGSAVISPQPLLVGNPLASTPRAAEAVARALEPAWGGLSWSERTQEPASGERGRSGNSTPLFGLLTNSGA